MTKDTQDAFKPKKAAAYAVAGICFLGTALAVAFLLIAGYVYAIDGNVIVHDGLMLLLLTIVVGAILSAIGVLALDVAGEQ